MKTITPQELKKKIADNSALFLLDVREPFEREIANIGGLHIPLAQLAGRVNEIPKDRDVVIYCKSGGRSARAVEALEHTFKFTNLINLEGGILRWIAEVDAGLKSY